MSTSVITKPNKPMSGYNLFVKNYVQRKDNGLDPYKLPDGTGFVGSFLRTEDNFRILQQNSDKINLES
jgi:hypothetical protein